MARIRTIKPDFWTDEKIMELPAMCRLLFLGLLNFADDYGRMSYSPMKIKAQVFPGDPIDGPEMDGMLKRLSSIGLVLIYSAEGRDYLAITNWDKHQKVDHKAVSKIPGPFDEPSRVLASPREDSRALAPDMEGKGREIEDTPDGVSGAYAPAAPPVSSRKHSKGTRMSPDWRPTERNRSDAAELGLTPADIERAWPRFRDYWTALAGAKGVKLDWDATWRNWCSKDAEKLGRAPPIGGQTEQANKFYALPESPELEAWDRYLKTTRGKSAPRDPRGGWWFDTQWPPEMAEAAE